MHSIRNALGLFVAGVSIQIALLWHIRVAGEMHSMDWTAAGTIITALATAYLAWVTRQYMKLTKCLVDESVSSRQLAQMPVLEAELLVETSGAGNTQPSRLALRIENTGSGPPVNVRVLWLTDRGEEIKDERIGVIGNGISVRLAMLEAEPFTFIELTYENVYRWHYSQRLTLARDEFWHISDRSQLTIASPTNPSGSTAAQP